MGFKWQGSFFNGTPTAQCSAQQRDPQLRTSVNINYRCY
jgi:hypothetical protein